MDAPEKIPLEEAIRKDLIPCSVCGRPGAAVRPAGSGKRFLCARCERRARRWAWLTAGLGAAAAAGLILLLIRPRGTAGPPVPPGLELVTHLRALVNQGRFQEGAALAEGAVKVDPRSGPLRFLLGRCLIGMGYHEFAVPHLQEALSGDGSDSDECRFWLAYAYHFMDREVEAVSYLEQPFASGARAEQNRRGLLAECYLEMERYEDALLEIETLETTPAVLRIRHRALFYLDRGEEARRVLDGLDAFSGQDPGVGVTKELLLAAQLREEGDFEGAFKALEGALGGAGEGSPDWFKLKRSEMALSLEAGNLDRLGAASAEVAATQDRHFVGEALWYRAVAELEAGRPDGARTAAEEFLKRVDPRHTPLRLERLMMSHLSARVRDADLEKEVQVLSRVRANDVYYYLALSTGEKSWGRKALESTPRRNFPYHAIRRLLQ